ncbi:MAG TPA: AEC family transporter [Clostridiaceae bacterium]|nr:AEC family transporter [Clostridiaceae bacterium]
MMSGSVEIVYKILPVILLIALGVLLEKRNFISKEAMGGIKKIVMNISLPTLLFLTLLGSELEPEHFLISAVVFAACVAGLTLGFLFKRLQRSQNQFYPSVFSSFVTGLVGYSLFISAFGQEHLYKLAILDIGNLLFIFIILMNFLQRVSCEFSGIKRLSLKDQLKGMLKSPILIGAFLGILASLSGAAPFIYDVPASSALVSVLTLLADSAVPMTLLVIGYDLHFDLRNFVKPAKAVMLRLTMMLAFAYLLNTFVIEGLMGLDHMFQMALYTMFILPPTFLIPVYIQGDCEEKSFILNFFTIHLVFTIIIFVILVAFMG